MSKKCLIIDDVEVSRYVIGEIVQTLGFAVVSSANEKEALAALKKENFDVIMLDWHLGKTESITFIPEIRKIHSSANTPIILCTGVELGKEMKDLKDISVQGFLKKPTTPDQIKEILKGLSLA